MPQHLPPIRVQRLLILRDSTAQLLHDPGLSSEPRSDSAIASVNVALTTPIASTITSGMLPMLTPYASQMAYPPAYTAKKAAEVSHHIKSLIGVTCTVAVKSPGEVPRSQGKAVRVRDLRKEAPK